MKLKDLNFKLPKELIALHPHKPRDQSNLVIAGRRNRIVKFTDILNELNPNDALIINNTKVINAELEGKLNGKKICINLNKIENHRLNIWSVLLKKQKNIANGDKINFFKTFSAIIQIKKNENNENLYFLKFNISLKQFKEKIRKLGKIPLPPYIKKRGLQIRDIKDYQTIFAKNEGAVASPTASLHFTQKLINQIKNKKISIIKVTLHINGGTFLPVKTNDISQHLMHFESGEITVSAANKINNVKKKGGKLIAVGTTVLRLLESSKDKKGNIKPFKGQTNIFIKPGWKVNTIDGIITNFHTPYSTLLALIFAILGKKQTLKLYDYAIKNKIRFFSYGDACLIWNKNE